MIYFVSLRLVALLLGLGYVAGHLPSALVPAPWLARLRRLITFYPLGAGLMLLATLWFTVLTGVMDLGELSNLRYPLMLLWLLAGLGVIIFVPGFLVARGAGCLLLLAAALILDAAFLVQTPARYVMTVLAYVWVIVGMILVYSPHYLRDWVYFATASTRRLQAFAWPGVVFGVLLVVLAIFVYGR